MKNDSRSKDPHPNRPLKIKPSSKTLCSSKKSFNLYNSISLKKSIKEFRNLNKISVRTKKMRQKDVQGIILQVKAPNGKLSIKRLLINDKIPEQVGNF